MIDLLMYIFCMLILLLYFNYGNVNLSYYILYICIFLGFYVYIYLNNFVLLNILKGFSYNFG